MKSLLHVGCGSDPLPEWLSEFAETRLDINSECSPDIVASMIDMGNIGEFDAIFCQHSLEHLWPHEVPIALSEFKRVLKSGGVAIIFVPDLEDVMATEEILLQSPAGPIAGLDMIYGYRKVLKDNPHMQHKTGFTKNTLQSEINKAGFAGEEVLRLGNYNLMAAAKKG